MTLGDRLCKLRREQGLSQHELARKADVRRPTISELESGKQHGVTVDTAKRLARVLGVGIDYLAGTWDDAEDDAREPILARVPGRGIPSIDAKGYAHDPEEEAMAKVRDELLNLSSSYQEFLDVAGTLGIQAGIVGDAVGEDPASASLAPLAARLQAQILAAVQRLTDEFPPELFAAMEAAEEFSGEH